MNFNKLYLFFIFTFKDLGCDAMISSACDNVFVDVAGANLFYQSAVTAKIIETSLQHPDTRRGP